jgi:signal transduction histidine kinase
VLILGAASTVLLATVADLRSRHARRRPSPWRSRRPTACRASASATTASGLVRPKDRVEALGGRIALRSEPGWGTSLSVELPLADASKER